MKSSFAVFILSYICSINSIAWADTSTNDILSTLAANFNPLRLKSIHIRYRVEIETAGERTRGYERLLIAQSNRYFCRTQNDFMPVEEFSQTWTNEMPQARYEWYDGVYEVYGMNIDHPGIVWEIKISDGMDYLSTLLPRFYLSYNDYDWIRVVNRKAITNGVVYYCTSHNGVVPLELTFGDVDGKGVAPIKRVCYIPDGRKDISEWSGWKKYGEIWIPSTYKTVEFIQDCREGSDGQIKESHNTFILLEVISVNEPISPRWFMPQFPARAFTIWDKTQDTERWIQNFDYDGKPYQ